MTIDTLLPGCAGSASLSPAKAPADDQKNRFDLALADSQEHLEHPETAHLHQTSEDHHTSRPTQNDDTTTGENHPDDPGMQTQKPTIAPDPEKPTPVQGPIQTPPDNAQMLKYALAARTQTPPPQHLPNQTPERKIQQQARLQNAGTFHLTAAVQTAAAAHLLLNNTGAAPKTQQTAQPAEPGNSQTCQKPDIAPNAGQNSQQNSPNVGSPAQLLAKTSDYTAPHDEKPRIAANQTTAVPPKLALRQQTNARQTFPAAKTAESPEKTPPITQQPANPGAPGLKATNLNHNADDPRNDANHTIRKPHALLNNPDLASQSAQEPKPGRPQNLSLADLSPEKLRLSLKQQKPQGQSRDPFASAPEPARLAAQNLHDRITPPKPQNTPQTNLPTEDHAPSVREQIRESIQASLANAGREITIRLNPPQLGRVSIRFTEQNNRLTGMLEADRAETRAEIHGALPQILKSLQQAGIQIKRLDVTLNDMSSSGRQPPKEQWFGDASSAQHGSPDPHGRTYYQPDPTDLNPQPYHLERSPQSHRTLTVGDSSLNILV